MESKQLQPDESYGLLVDLAEYMYFIANDIKRNKTKLKELILPNEDLEKVIKFETNVFDKSSILLDRALMLTTQEELTEKQKSELERILFLINDIKDIGNRSRHDTTKNPTVLAGQRIIQKVNTWLETKDNDGLRLLDVALDSYPEEKPDIIYFEEFSNPQTMEGETSKGKAILTKMLDSRQLTIKQATSISSKSFLIDVDEDGSQEEVHSNQEKKYASGEISNKSDNLEKRVILPSDRNVSEDTSLNKRTLVINPQLNKQKNIEIFNNLEENQKKIANQLLVALGSHITQNRFNFVIEHVRDFENDNDKVNAFKNCIKTMHESGYEINSRQLNRLANLDSTKLAIANELLDTMPQELDKVISYLDKKQNLKRNEVVKAKLAIDLLWILKKSITIKNFDEVFEKIKEGDLTRKHLDGLNLTSIAYLLINDNAVKEAIQQINKPVPLDFHQSPGVQVQARTLDVDPNKLPANQEKISALAECIKSLHEIGSDITSSQLATLATLHTANLKAAKELLGVMPKKLDRIITYLKGKETLPNQAELAAHFIWFLKSKTHENLDSILDNIDKFHVEKENEIYQMNNLIRNMEAKGISLKDNLDKIMQNSSIILPLFTAMESITQKRLGVMLIHLDQIKEGDSQVKVGLLINIVKKMEANRVHLTDENNFLETLMQSSREVLENLNNSYKGSKLSFFRSDTESFRRKLEDAIKNTEKPHPKAEKTTENLPASLKALADHFINFAKNPELIKHGEAGEDYNITLLNRFILQKDTYKKSKKENNPAAVAELENLSLLADELARERARNNLDISLIQTQGRDCII